MATTKNITMKQFNGTDYDTLYPKTIASQIPDVYSKIDTITAETLSRLGLSADKLPNDAFQQIKTLIDNVQSSADSKARIQTGSYVGTGTYGVDNPCSLTFDFEPKLLIVGAVKGANRGWFQTNSDYGLICDGLFWVNPMPYIWNMDNYSSSLTTSYLYFTPNVTGISYYSTKGAGSQCNVSNRTYYYFGIG